jgi:hypothetical protein
MRTRAQSNDTAEIADDGEERRRQKRDDKHHPEKQDKLAARSLSVADDLFADLL